MTQATFTFRVDADLKDAFASVAQANDRSGAQLLRDFMRQYVQDHADTISYDQWFRSKVEESRRVIARDGAVSLEDAEADSKALRDELLQRSVN